MKFWLRSPLFEEAGEGAGGGGGAGAGDKPGAFDPVAFKAEILGEFNRTINGALKGLKSDITKLIKPAEGSGEGSGGEGGGQGEGGGEGGQGKPDAKYRQLETRFKTLETQLTTERQARETAETRGRNADRDRAVQQALSSFQFADAAAGKDAFDLHRGAVKWSEEGVLVGPDDQPLEDFIKTSMGNKQYLLAPREVGGAGARRPGQAASRAFTLDDIDNPNLSAEDKTKLRQQIAASLGAAQSGR